MSTLMLYKGVIIDKLHDCRMNSASEEYKSRNKSSRERVRMKTYLSTVILTLLVFVLLDVEETVSYSIPKCDDDKIATCDYQCQEMDCANFRKDPDLNMAIDDWRSCSDRYEVRNEENKEVYYAGDSLPQQCKDSINNWRCICKYPTIQFAKHLDGSDFECFTQKQCLDTIKNLPICYEVNQAKYCKYECEVMNCTTYRNNVEAHKDWNKCIRSYIGTYSDSIMKYTENDENCTNPMTECMCNEPYIRNDLPAEYVRAHGYCIDKYHCLRVDLSKKPKTTFNSTLSVSGLFFPRCTRAMEHRYCNYDCALPVMTCKAYFENLKGKAVKDWNKCIQRYKMISANDYQHYYKSEKELHICLKNNNPTIKWSDCYCAVDSLKEHMYSLSIKTLSCWKKTDDACYIHGPPTKPPQPKPGSRFVYSDVVVEPKISSQYAYDYLQSLDPNDPSWKQPGPNTSDYYDFLDFIRPPL